MELQTGLDPIHWENEFSQIIGKLDKGVICFGPMGPMCVPVRSAREQVESILVIHF